MPRRKITLEEAFAAIEASGLQIEVKAVKGESNDNARLQQLSDFIEDEYVQQPTAKQVNDKKVKITLRCQHTVSCGGYVVDTPDGKRVEGNGIETYGPGIITVPAYLAEHLLHQDAAAVRNDERMFDRRFRSYIVQDTGTGVRGFCVDESGTLDMSKLLGSIGEPGSNVKPLFIL